MSGLQKTVQSIPLTQGVNTKDSPTLMDQGMFLALQNAVFTKGAAGSLHKRNGYGALPQVDSAGNALTNGTALSVFNGEIDACYNGSLYFYSPDLQAWVAVAPKFTQNMVSIGVLERPIGKSSYNQSNVDSIVYLNTTSANPSVLYAWEDARGGVWWAQFDENSGSLIRPAAQVNATGSCPKWIKGTTSTRLLLTDASGNLWIYTVPAALASPISGTVLLSGLGLANPVFDACVVNGYAAVTVAQSGGWYVMLFTLSTFGPVTQITFAGSVPLSISCAAVGTQLSVANGFSTGSLPIYFYNTPALSLAHSYSVVASGGAIKNLTQSPGASSTAVFFQTEPVGSVDRFVTDTVVSVASGVVATGVIARGVGLASQPLVYGGNIFLMVVNSSVVQQTAFLIDTNGNVMAKYYPQVAGPFSTHARLPAFQPIQTGIYALAMTQQVSIVSVAGVATVIDAVSELQLNFTATGYTAAQLGQNAYFPLGSLLKGYDGAQVCEDGFNVFPEAPTVTQLVSNITLTVTMDSTDTAFNQSFTIQFPQASVIARGSATITTDGQLITPGEYWVMAGSNGGTFTGTQSTYFWYSVSGVGTDPGLGGSWTSVQVAINSTDSAATIATKTLAAFNATVTGLTSSFTGYVSSPGTLGFYEIALANYSRPALNRQFQVSQTTFGSAGTKGSVTVSCCPGSLIRPNEFFTYVSGITFPVTVTYSVDGFGGYVATPSYSGTRYLVKVAVLSTDSEIQIATKTAAAINAGGPGPSLATATSSGNQVLITNGSNGVVASAAFNGGVGATQSYTYVAMYESFDAFGQVHRSAASVPTVAQLPAFSGLYVPADIFVTVQSLRLTNKPNCDIVIYRTVGLGGILYRLTSPTSLLVNAPTVDSVTFTDQVLDTVLAASEVLYATVGAFQNAGALNNSGPPAFTWCTTFQDRLWGVSSEDTSLLWFSKLFSAGVGVEWTNLNTLRIDQIGGPIVSLAVMDSVLVVFCQRNIWAISGQGPDNTGNGFFTGPTLVSSSMGIRDANSLVLTAEGLFFKSIKGWHILDRNLQTVAYIGAAVEAYNADIVSSAQAIDNTTAVRMLSVNGTALVYDYFEKAWGTFTNHSGYDDVKLAGLYYYMTTAGTVFYETPGVYADNGVGFPMVVTTSWVKLAGIQGFKRVWKTFLKGFFTGLGSYQVSIAYNYNGQSTPTASETWVFNLNSGATSTSWGYAATWGSYTEAWGGNSAGTVTFPDVLQFRVLNATSACESISVTVTDLAPYVTTVSYSLDSMDLEVGLKKGGFLVPSSQTQG